MLNCYVDKKESSFWFIYYLYNDDGRFHLNPEYLWRESMRVSLSKKLWYPIMKNSTFFIMTKHVGIYYKGLTIDKTSVPINGKIYIKYMNKNEIHNPMFKNNRYLHFYHEDEMYIPNDEMDKKYIRKEGNVKFHV